MNQTAPEPNFSVALIDTLSQSRKELLSVINKSLNAAATFADVLPDLEGYMLKFLEGQRLTVYQNARDGQEIIAKYKTGQELLEIRLPLTATSIAGYVAVSGNPIRIDDVYDAEALRRIHKTLNFNAQFDQRSGFRSRSMMVVPIKNNAPLLGVLQVINKVGGDRFSEEDMKLALYLAGLLAKKFHQEFEATDSPYDFLVKRELITLEKIDAFQKRAKKEGVTMTYLLVQEQKIPQELIAASLASYHQVPFMRYDPNITPPKNLLKKLNMSYLRRQLWVPLAGDPNEELLILIDDPSDFARQMEIQRALPAKKYIFRVGFPEDILQYLGGGSVSSFLHGLAGKMEDEDVEDSERLEEGVEAGEINENESTVIQLVHRLIIDAYRAGASDIHVEPGKGKSPSAVRLRIDGICKQALEIPSTHIRAVLSRIKIMSRMDIAERRKPQDGKILVKVKGQPLELRVATIPTVMGESAVMRVLASGSGVSFDKLNLSERNYKELDRLMLTPQGILLVVGPTGSGKTTTLHSVIGRINTPERKIWTAEDPVEITQPGLQQVQIDHKIGFNFAAALRSFLRADPDVILIGEMRDAETAHSGIEASLTGHLVFSTLHTNSAPETIIRLLDLGLDPLNFADALLGILAQRLVRTLCEACKQGYKPQEEEWERLQRLYGEQYWDELGRKREETVLFGPGGCGKCNKTGFKGRTGIHELLVNSKRLTKAIAHKGTAEELRAIGMEEGMRTLLQDGVVKVLKGQIDLSQLFRVAVE
ncbi:MAG: GspE/PulE family protein [Nitrospirae bacterium]|nr:GspE/PulE family protein [Magnetococcales bacterium]HAT51532.1 general secretion pathway protein GspE [Alphaproteobacteria bacterium]